MTRRLLDWQPASPSRYPCLASALFLSEKEFLAQALAAYNAASRDLVPPPGERWLDRHNGPYSNAEGFYDSLVHHFSERLRRRAYLTGHMVQSPGPGEVADEPGPGAGRSPADMGHGWPASASAGGPRSSGPSASPERVTPMQNGFSSSDDGKDFQ